MKTISLLSVVIMMLLPAAAWGVLEVFEDFEGSTTIDSSKWVIWSGNGGASFQARVADGTETGAIGKAGFTGNYLTINDTSLSNNLGDLRECGIMYKDTIDFTKDPVLIEYDGLECYDEFGVGFTWNSNITRFIGGTTDAITSYAMNSQVPWTYSQAGTGIYNQHVVPTGYRGNYHFRLYFQYLGNQRLSVEISVWMDSSEFAGDYLSQSEQVLSPLVTGELQEWQFNESFNDCEALYVFFRFRDAWGPLPPPYTPVTGNDIRIDNIHIRVGPLNLPVPIDVIVTSATVQWASEVGAYYKVEWRDTVSDPWTVAPPLHRGDGDTITWVDMGDPEVGRSAPTLDGETPSRQYRIFKVFQ